MAKVGALFKIFTDEGKLDEVTDEIKKELKPQDIRSEELAFGIKVIKALFVFEDSEVGSSSIEEKLKKVKGVSEVEVEQESLI
jgi:translation elongation factor EF-1beta